MQEADKTLLPAPPLWLSSIYLVVPDRYCYADWAKGRGDALCNAIGELMVLTSRHF
jgi:hypothetical protein